MGVEPERPARESERRAGEAAPGGQEAGRRVKNGDRKPLISAKMRVVGIGIPGCGEAAGYLTATYTKLVGGARALGGKRIRMRLSTAPQSGQSARGRP